MNGTNAKANTLDALAATADAKVRVGEGTPPNPPKAPNRRGPGGPRQDNAMGVCIKPGPCPCADPCSWYFELQGEADGFALHQVQHAIKAHWDAQPYAECELAPLAGMYRERDRLAERVLARCAETPLDLRAKGRAALALAIEPEDDDACELAATMALALAADVMWLKIEVRS